MKPGQHDLADAINDLAKAVTEAAVTISEAILASHEGAQGRLDDAHNRELIAEEIGLQARRGATLPGKP